MLGVILKKGRTMELHSPQSLYRVHGLSIEPTRPGAISIGSLLARLGDLARAISHEVRCKRAVAELAAMDNHLLRDIGVHRSEIRHFVRHGRPEPRHQLLQRRRPVTARPR